jgi:hypothetical protein
MSNFRLILRSILITISMVLACLLLANKMGLGDIGCTDKCQDLDRAWYSIPFLIGLFVGNIAFVVSLRSKSESLQSGIAAILGLCGLFAFWVMLNARAFCVLCLCCQILWVFLMIEVLTSRWPKVQIGLAALLAISVSYGVNDSNRPLAVPPKFVLRPYEKVARTLPHAAVIFGDPLCPHCRDAERSLSSGHPPIPVLYRWKLLAENGYSSVKLVAAIESAMNEDAVKGAELRKAIFLSRNPENVEGDVALAKRCGFDEAKFRRWIQTPEPASLQLIEQDGKLAAELYLKEIPTLGLLTSFRTSNEPSIRVADRKYLHTYDTNFAGLSIFDIYLH